MTIYFAGHEADTLALSGAAYVTTAGTFDADYSRASIEVSLSESATIDIPSLLGDADATGWWLHIYIHPVDPYQDAHTALLSVYDDVGNESVSLTFSNGAMSQKLFSYQSTTATTELSGFTMASGGYHLIDLHCYTSGGDSFLDVYIGGALTKTTTRTTDSNTGLSQVKLFGAVLSSAREVHFSEIIIADTDIRGHRVKTLVPNADGANTDWTGAYTDIDEIIPDGSGIAANAVGDIETYATAGLGDLAGMGIAAVCVNGLVSGNGTNDVQAVIRKGGTNYFSSDIGITTGLLPYVTVWNTDPSTGGSWGTDDLSAVEFGFKAVT